MTSQQAEINRCAVLTPAGRGAIAVVAVAGPQCVEIVERCFVSATGRRLSEQKVGQILFGRWGDAAGEEIVVARQPEGVEIHCHGGRAASEAICTRLQQEGCHRTPPEEWVRENESSTLRAAARLALASATTERTALVLLDQYNGALERELLTMTELIDAGDLAAARRQGETLLARWSVGRWLARPARVVLAGPPNVGKSSLINALVGYERAIVFDTPGTTRDVVTARTAIDGWSVELSDTAGIRRATSELEKEGIALARAAVASADVVLLVDEAVRLTAGRPGSAGEELLIDLAETPHLVVANKIDRLAPHERKRLAHVVPTCATSGEGMEILVAEIARLLAPQPLPPGAGVPFDPSHAVALEQAVEAIATDRPADARRVLTELVGSRRSG